MPEISRFSGMVVHMYWDDHPWPHIHVRYAEYTASFDLRTMHFTRGDLPRRRNANYCDGRACTRTNY